MATISIFYGIIISMMYMDNKQHTIPHVHADYQGQSVVLSIPVGISCSWQKCFYNRSFKI